ncbi:M56 family metallopeptidase [Ruegeria lacuscaerulensis]|uniref:M56 family metallopeptidase n=1 Tax=Ruegeria lacuscaerulensis TaxID=55218 RepID=UPI001479A6E8|nr:M56 family metallopeptidase [Ruegeria lacuscaerulensis]
MTAVKPVLDAYLEWNIVLALAALVWLVVRAIMGRTRLQYGFVAQLQALKALCLCVVLSPVLAIGAFALTSAHGTVALGDIAVAAYLRGDIAMPATQFEALLNTRERWVEVFVSGAYPGLSAIFGLVVVMAAAYAVRVLRDGLAIRETIQTSFLWRHSAKVDIRLSDRIAVPFAVRGLRRRHVVLPSHLLDTPRELRFALAHELQHVRAGDVEWELGFEILRPLLFWNPAYLVLKYQFDRLRELACDQSVVARRGINARDYTACLLDYCARTVRKGSPRVLNVALVTGGKAKRVLRQRVMALAEAPAVRSGTPVLFLGLTLVFATVLGFGAASVQQTEDWSHDRLMLSTVVNLERLEARNSGN